MTYSNYKRLIIDEVFKELCLDVKENHEFFWQLMKMNKDSCELLLKKIKSSRTERWKK